MTADAADVVVAGYHWAGEQLRRRIVDVQRLRGGWTSTMLRLCDDAGDAWVLRLMDREPWRQHGAALVRRESWAQQLLTASAVPVPRSMALDPGGDLAGHPAHLMSWLPGDLELRQHSAEVLQAAARTLATIHDIRPATRPRLFQSWAVPAKRVVPPWAGDDEVWTTAFDYLASTPEPSYEGIFLHRDFHFGNLLWNDGAVSGIVDWVETSWGPAWLDVAHCQTYLAMLHGPATAADFAAAYDDLTPGSQQRRYWEVLDAVGFLPDPVKVTKPWRDHGRELDDATARNRLEQHLARVLETDR